MKRQTWEFLQVEQKDNGRYKYIIKLKQNLYGTINDDKNVYIKLLAGIKSRGFVKYKVDSCFFLGEYFTVLYTLMTVYYSIGLQKYLIIWLQIWNKIGFLVNGKGDTLDLLWSRIQHKGEGTPHTT